MTSPRGDEGEEEEEEEEKEERRASEARRKRLWELPPPHILPLPPKSPNADFYIFFSFTFFLRAHAKQNLHASVTVHTVHTVRTVTYDDYTHTIGRINLYYNAKN